MILLTEQEIFECLPDNGDSIAFARAIEAKTRSKVIERIAVWLEPQRNDIPAIGEEFAAAIRALKD